MTSFRITAAAACLWLAGCATYSADGGFGTVADGARHERGVDARWLRTEAERRDAQAQVSALLQQPLSPEDAVHIAVLNNHGLQAQFESLKISEAQLVRSGRLPNPSFTYAHATGGGLYNIEEKLSFNLIALVSLPYLHGTEQHRFAATQQALVLDITTLADATRRSYYTALAARDSRQYAEQVAEAAQVGGELALRMRNAGNWNELEAANERSFALGAAQDLTRARLAETDAMESLYRLLGLDSASGNAGPPALTLAEHLPTLPDAPATTAEAAAAAAAAEQRGLDSRLDLQLQRAELEALARRLKLTQTTRFINVLEAGPTRIRDGTRNDPYETGYEVTVEIPLFDGGSARLREAEAIYARAAERFAQSAVQARSDIRTSLARVRTSYDIAARQRAEVLPLRTLVSRENLLRYNAGQLSVFDLLADARARIDAVDTYIRSVRDYWLAQSALDSALTGAAALDSFQG